MSTFGSPQTGAFIIGTQEVRIGPLNKAGLLTQAHSIGVIDQVNFTVNQNSVDLSAGFPQEPIDTAITSQVSGATMTLREYSKRNLQILLGGAQADYVAPGGDVLGVVDTTSSIAADSTSIVLTSVTGTPAAGQVVVFYSLTDPGLVAVSVIDSYNSGTKTVTLTTGMGLSVGFAAGANVRMYRADPIAVGNVTQVNYFSVQLLRTDRATGRPVVTDFWKAAIASGMQMGATAAEFASTELQLKFLKPAASDIAGSLSHQASQIALYPTARISMPPDFL